MTVTYIGDVQTAKGGTFMKLLMKWRGGVGKAIWGELLVYLVLYASISLTYRTYSWYLEDKHSDIKNGFEINLMVPEKTIGLPLKDIRNY